VARSQGNKKERLRTILAMLAGRKKPGLMWASSRVRQRPCGAANAYRCATASPSHLTLCAPSPQGTTKCRPCTLTWSRITRSRE
jgi:hypothetical protein